MRSIDLRLQACESNSWKCGFCNSEVADKQERERRKEQPRSITYVRYWTLAGQTESCCAHSPLHPAIVFPTNSET
jgi:hypothetical protein